MTILRGPSLPAPSPTQSLPSAELRWGPGGSLYFLGCFALGLPARWPRMTAGGQVARQVGAFLGFILTRRQLSSEAPHTCKGRGSQLPTAAGPGLTRSLSAPLTLFTLFTCLSCVSMGVCFPQDPRPA